MCTPSVITNCSNCYFEKDNRICQKWRVVSIKAFIHIAQEDVFGWAQQLCLEAWLSSTRLHQNLEEKWKLSYKHILQPGKDGQARLVPHTPAQRVCASSSWRTSHSAGSVPLLRGWKPPALEHGAGRPWKLASAASSVWAKANQACFKTNLPQDLP